MLRQFIVLLLLTVPAAAQYWTLQPTSNGFQWAPPSGPAVCKLAGVSVMDTPQIVRTGQFPTLIPDKYPDTQTWANKQAERIKSWGFNEAGYASSNKIPLPFNIFFATSGWATRDDKSWHIKQLSWNYTGMVCGGSYHVASGGGQIDVYDPGIATAYNAASVGLVNGCGGKCFNANTTFIIPDEGDAAYGINNVNNHEDLFVIIASENPMMTHSYAGGYTYTDRLVYAKTAMRDFLANEYGCAGSADPAAGNYCGDTDAASALSALNTAWSTSYTTWNTSDAGGIAGIKAGTYTSYGTGTGLLDEDGTNILNTATKSSCHSKPGDTWEVTSQEKTDGHAFIAALAGTYASTLSAAYAQSSLNPAPPIFLVLYDSPSYVYPAVVTNFTNLGGLWISPILESTASDRLAMAQRVIANSSTMGHSVPIYWTDFFNTINDCYPTCTSTSYGNGTFSSQYTKGAAMVTDWQNILPLQDVNGKYVIVGIEHWALYDQVNEFGDGGLVSAYADNPYDGSASIATATRSTLWQSSHTYTLPSVIWDGLSFEATSFGADSPAASCVSNSTEPTWAIKMGATTTDGTCVWRNEGPYNLKPESAARIPATATLPSVAYGDTITPISNFLNAGICSPAGTLVITSSTCPTGVVGTPYTCNMTATGGVTPYTWSFSSGDLSGCTGLSLSTVGNTGVISGTPTVAATCSFTEMVTDSTPVTPLTATQPNSVTINPAPSGCHVAAPGCNAAAPGCLVRPTPVI